MMPNGSRLPETAVDPRTDDAAEVDPMRAVAKANARTSVGDALETIRARLGE